MAWQRNTGRLPEEAKGKRIRVRLRGGQAPAETWAADGKAGASWALTGAPFDIAEWEIA